MGGELTDTTADAPLLRLPPLEAPFPPRCVAPCWGARVGLIEKALIGERREELFSGTRGAQDKAGKRTSVGTEKVPVAISAGGGGGETSRVGAIDAP